MGYEQVKQSVDADKESATWNMLKDLFLGEIDTTLVRLEFSDEILCSVRPNRPPPRPAPARLPPRPQPQQVVNFCSYCGRKMVAGVDECKGCGAPT